MLLKQSVLFASTIGIARAVPAASLVSRDPYDDSFCPVGYPSVIIEHQIQEVAYPVIINQFFEQNTDIVINGGLTININNAPTSVSSTVIVTTTATVTSTA